MIDRMYINKDIKMPKTSTFQEEKYRNFPMVPRVMFGKGSFNQLGEILLSETQAFRCPFYLFGR